MSQLTASPSWVALLWTCLIWATPAFAHPFHASLAEAEWNAASGKLEVALQVDAYDLQTGLRQFLNKAITLEEEAAEVAAQDYLRRHFRVTYDAEAPLPLEWVGLEVARSKAWLYFEIPLPRGPEGIRIDNTVLSHVPNQVNTVTLRHAEARRTFVTSPQ